MSRRPFKPANLPELLVADPAGLAQCVDHLQNHTLIGFDTEFVGEDTYRPDLCLVQVSTRERLYLIDPFEAGPLDRFWQLMHDPARTIIAHAGREEVRMCRFLSGTAPANLFDAQIAAGLIGLTYPIGYAGLVQAVLGSRLNKSDTLSDWRRRPLSDSQVRYAYDDVRFLIPAYERIHNRLTKYDRLSWAADEFTTFVRWATGDDEIPEERWRKVKGIGALHRRELAVARSMFQWREEVAVRRNRPARTVMRDDVLIEVARRGSRNPDEVQNLRGVQRGEAETITTLARAANKIPLNQCPTVQANETDPPQVAVLGSLLNVVLTDVCERLKLAQNLVCSQQDLKDLVRARQPDATLVEDSPFRTGWRREHILPHLERVLDGGLMVRVNNTQLPAPLEYIEPIGDEEAET
jgi:ribonuclease D